uniref:PEPxxWA-CTERM sorting domain-containing protein n=1 Tax=Altererythrobacter segetis TaxID=1104773 RepID=UPI00140E72BE|nr:PEPxxWA-CTERM sorting domain-containing protein [Altererythrobacter segetis]
MIRRVNRLTLFALATLSGLSWASSAEAGKPVAAPPPGCSTVTFSVTTLDCLGFYEGNLVAEDGPKLTQALGLTSGLDGDASSLLEKIEWGSGQDGNPIDFLTSLSGKTVIGIHFGGGRDGYNGTGFWLLDAPADTDKITWYSNTQSGISNAGLYLTQVPPAVPEPSTWALLLVGFAALGGAMRRLRLGNNAKVALAYKDT